MTVVRESAETQKNNKEAGRIDYGQDKPLAVPEGQDG